MQVQDYIALNRLHTITMHAWTYIGHTVDDDVVYRCMALVDKLCANRSDVIAHLYVSNTKTAEDYEEYSSFTYESNQKRGSGSIVQCLRWILLYTSCMNHTTSLAPPVQSADCFTQSAQLPTSVAEKHRNAEETNRELSKASVNCYKYL